MKLYFTNLYNSLIVSIPHLKKVARPISNELTVLYAEGQRRLDKNLDVIKLVRDVKYLKMIIRYLVKPNFETNF